MTCNYYPQLLRSRAIWYFLFLLIGPFTSFVSAQSDEDCMMCHEDRSMTGVVNGKTVSVFVDTSIFSGSVHHANSCLSCHTDAADEGFPHADDLNPVNCGNCHADELANNVRGIHGQALLRNASQCAQLQGVPRPSRYPAQYKS